MKSIDFSHIGTWKIIHEDDEAIDNVKMLEPVLSEYEMPLALIPVPDVLMAYQQLKRIPAKEHEFGSQFRVPLVKTLDAFNATCNIIDIRWSM